MSSRAYDRDDHTVRDAATDVEWLELTEAGEYRYAMFDDTSMEAFILATEDAVVDIDDLQGGWP